MQMFNSGNVSLGPGGSGGVYMKGPTDKLPAPKGGAPQADQQTLGAQAVRATGSGPFDNTYRQNLATYAGGFSQRPGGFLGFNPTGNIMGGPTGGGNAPVMGGPTDLLTAAMGGQGFSTPQQASAPSPTPGASTGQARNPLSFWLNQFQNQGNPFRGAL